MRQRPKQASYSDRLNRDAVGGLKPAGVEYDKKTGRVRDPSPIAVGGKIVRGVNNLSEAGRKGKHEESPSSSAGVPGAVIKQYKSLDDVPDGLPESPKWGTTWVPRSVAVSPRAGDRDDDDDNYWISTVSKSSPPARGAPAPPPAQYRGDLSPREEAGHYSSEQPRIPRQAHQPMSMRPMPQQLSSELDGEHQYQHRQQYQYRHDDEEEEEEGKGAGGGYSQSYAYASSARTQADGLGSGSRPRPRPSPRPRSGSSDRERGDGREGWEGASSRAWAGGSRGSHWRLGLGGLQGWHATRGAGKGRQTHATGN